MTKLYVWLVLVVLLFALNILTGIHVGMWYSWVSVGVLLMAIPYYIMRIIEGHRERKVHNVTWVNTTYGLDPAVMADITAFVKEERGPLGTNR